MNFGLTCSGNFYNKDFTLQYTQMSSSVVVFSNKSYTQSLLQIKPSLTLFIKSAYTNSIFVNDNMDTGDATNKTDIHINNPYFSLNFSFTLLEQVSLQSYSL